MVEPSGHCPHLGLKQNRAIRFASPTPEHRCYVTGEAQDIPVDQTTYCLSQGHVNCPLYMGLTPPSTSPYLQPVEAVPQGGLRGWLRGLSPRDRAIYTVLLGLLVVVIGIYIAVGARLLMNDGTIGGNSTQPLPATTEVLPAAATRTATVTPTASTPPTHTPTASATPTVTMTPTVTATPTSTPSVTPQPIFIPPTAPPPPVIWPSATPIPPSPTFVPASATPEPASPTFTPPEPTFAPASPTPAPASPTFAPASPTFAPASPTAVLPSPTFVPASATPVPPSPILEPPTDIPDVTFVPNTPEPRPTAQPATGIPQSGRT